MSRYPLGQPVRVSTTIKDLTGAPVDAGTLKLTVRRPDASTQDYLTPAHDGAAGSGTYHQDIPAADATQLGHYAYVWTATGAGAGVSPPSGFEVHDPFEVTVLSLQDGKDALNKSQTVVTDDAELLRKIATIESNLEKTTGGPIINRQITERVELVGGYTAFLVRKRPIVSVQSLVSVASGAALNISDLEWDPNSNIVRRKLALPFYGPFFTWLPTFTVTYTAGLGTAVPPSVQDAAGIILQHLWEPQRGMSSNPRYGGNEDTITLPGWSFAIPTLAAELLSPYALEAYV